MHQSLRIGVIMVGSLVAALTASPAVGDAGPGNGTGDASAGSDDSGLIVTVSNGDASGTDTGESSSSEPTEIPTCGLKFFDGTFLPGPADEEGHWVVDTCKDPADPTAIAWVPDSPASAVTPASVAQTALARAPWPPITVRMNPPASRLLVRFPTWLHLDSGWQTVTASASVGGVSATVTARPEWARWDMGDGQAVTCHGPGTGYDPALSWSDNVGRRDCTYTYSRSSARSPGARFTVAVTIHYAVTWTTTGVGGGGSLGAEDRTTSFPVAVGQLKSLDD